MARNFPKNQKIYNSSGLQQSFLPSEKLPRGKINFTDSSGNILNLNNSKFSIELFFETTESLITTNRSDLASDYAVNIINKNITQHPYDELFGSLK